MVDYNKDYLDPKTGTAKKILPGISMNVNKNGGAYMYEGKALEGVSNQFQAQNAVAKMRGLKPNEYNTYMGNRGEGDGSSPPGYIPGTSQTYAERAAWEAGRTNRPNTTTTPSQGGMLSQARGQDPSYAQQMNKVRGEAEANKTTGYVRGIDQGRDTVAGQLASYERADSDLAQLLKRQGSEDAAKKGLLSSSIASGAARAKFLEGATPIAQQDAAAYLKQAQVNQDTINQFRGRQQESDLVQDRTAQEYGLKGDLTEQEYGLKGDLTAQEYGLKGEQTKLESGLNIDQIRAEYLEKGNLESQMSAADSKQKLELLGTEYGLKADQLAQQFGYTQAEAGGKQNAALSAQYIQAVAEINKSDMSVSDKRAQIESLREMTLSSQAATAMSFGHEKMQDFYEGQLTNIGAAAAAGASEGGKMQAPTPGAPYQLNLTDDYTKSGAFNPELGYDGSVTQINATNADLISEIDQLGDFLNVDDRGRWGLFGTPDMTTQQKLDGFLSADDKYKNLSELDRQTVIHNRALQEVYWLRSLMGQSEAAPDITSGIAPSFGSF